MLSVMGGFSYAFYCYQSFFETPDFTYNQVFKFPQIKCQKKRKQPCVFLVLRSWHGWQLRHFGEWETQN